MKIITAYTADLKEQAKSSNIECIRIYEPSDLESHTIQEENDFPKNRRKYSTPQGGEFVDWLDDDYDGLICFTDADMIQQREITAEEMKLVAPAKGEFTACYNSYPPRTLNDAQRGLMMTGEPWHFGTFIEFQAGVLIAHRKDWEELRDRYLHLYPAFCKQYKHHAMTQLLINFLVQRNFKLKLAPDWLHNGYWLTGTNAHRHTETGKMWTGREVVFNHYKFNKSYI